MADWISIWNQATRNDPRHQSLAGKPLDSAWVPYLGSDISPGDRIYIVGIQDGELLLVSRVVVGGISVRTGGDWADVETEPGTELEVRFDRVLDPNVTNQLVLASRSGEELKVRRDANGAVTRGQFQGIGSVRQVLSGGKLLDAAIRPS